MRINCQLKSMKSCLFERLSARSILNAAVAVVGAVVLTASAKATNLALNGDFEQLLVPGFSAEFGSRYPSQQVTDWTTTGYNFVFTPGSADTSGSLGEYGGLTLWGPNNGSSNGLPAASPSGGNFLAMDGAYAVGPVSQTINGLTPGNGTTVSFYWAGAQQFGYNSATTEQFQVSLGSEVKFTPVVNNANHGFTGWQHESMSFVPTSSSELLSFLAIGTPAGVPPFSLLDGVVVGTPEPATWALLMASFAGIGGLALLRRRSERQNKVS